jgi:hypothetical protein
MTKKLNVFALLDPTMTSDRGVAIAIKNVITERLGTDLKVYTPLRRELVAVIEVEDSTELARLLDPGQYRAFYPSITRVELEPAP